MPKRFIQTLEEMLERSKQPPLESEVIDFIRMKAEVIVYPARHLLLRAGRPCGDLLFLNSGMARSFVLRDDKEVTTWFMLPGQLATVPERFLAEADEEPDEENVELMTESEVLIFHRPDLEYLYDQYRSVNYVSRKITEFYLKQLSRRLKTTVPLNSKARYDALQKISPELINLVPAKLLATFLGMDERTLSRLKSMQYK